jgi:hypothetical protein
MHCARSGGTDSSDKKRQDVCRLIAGKVANNKAAINLNIPIKVLVRNYNHAKNYTGRLVLPPAPLQILQCKGTNKPENHTRKTFPDNGFRMLTRKRFRSALDSRSLILDRTR